MRAGADATAIGDVLAAYAAEAPRLTEAWSALDPAIVYAPVADMLPDRPTTVLDIGAGTGGDAAWFAKSGHRVVAVEPVEPLRLAGIAGCAGLDARWVDDRLPALDQPETRGRYGLIVLNGVWHHLPPPDREAAWPELSSRLEPTGLLLMALRHGPSAGSRRAWPIDPERTAADARRQGLGVLRRVDATSIQPGNRAAGVTWTWIVFARMDAAAPGRANRLRS